MLVRPLENLSKETDAYLENIHLTVTIKLPDCMV